MNGEAATIGHNLPPVSVDVRSRNKELFDEMDRLAGAEALVPEVIDNDEDEGAAQDLAMKCKKTVAQSKAIYKVEVEPLNATLKVIKNAFAIPQQKVEETAKAVVARIDVYKDKKAAAERRRREDEAEKQRQEAERLAQEAAAAEARRVEAERARREEEEKARMAELAKLQAQEDARRAREREAAAKAEQQRLEAEAKARREREEIEAKARAERAEADAEADRLAQERRDAEAKAHAEAMEKARVEREQAEMDAREARDRQQKALEERRLADEAAKIAKQQERSAARDEKHNLADAVRTEKRADRLDDSAQASAADLSRGRGEYGSVGSLTTRWTWRMVDRDKLPPAKLWHLINPDAIDAAITRFLSANRPELGKGRDNNDLLPGVEFYQETTTVVR